MTRDGSSGVAADVLGLAVVVPVVARLDGQARREQHEEDDVEQREHMVTNVVLAERPRRRHPLDPDGNLKFVVQFA